jgi:ApaG protein
MSPDDIQIEVNPAFIPEQSSPENGKYFFSYTISIANRGKENCQLISRYWLITDAAGNQQEVSGEGVVGKQPRLDPGESFVYTSGVMLNTAVGTMQGIYHMVDAKGGTFDAPIQPFLLAQPGKIN